jgi:hypothetical protein
LLWSAAFVALGAVPASAAWEELAPGLELGVFKASHKNADDDSKIHVLRADPEEWKLKTVCAGRNGLPENTARGWADHFGLVAATNAGMFDLDRKTHVGYFVDGDYVNNGRVNQYRSVAVFDAKTPHAAEFHVLDLDRPKQEITRLSESYGTIIQNLRLIARSGENRWSQQPKKWSEAALGEDEQGRILFIFCRSPYTMHDLNDELLGLGIGLVAAHHLEGGPEAQLFVAPMKLELFGSYESGFLEDDRNGRAWPVPNVIGLVPRQAADGESR